MINKLFDLINKSDIDALIYNGVAETRTLEYKEKLSVNSDEDKKEFLADISSFANTSGGDIIYGIQEQRSSDNKTTGIPEAANGVGAINSDAEIRRLENIIRDGVAPRIIGLQTKAIDGFADGLVIVIRVPKSWNSPHMVTFKNHSRFYSRNSAGKYPLDVTEIRSAFIASESLADKMGQFRTERIAKVIADETPVPLQPNPKIVLHVLPITSFTAGSNIDLNLISNNSSDLRLINSFNSSIRYNFDGFLRYANNNTLPIISYAYTQIFRNGAIEAVEAYMLKAWDEKRLIPSVAFEEKLINSLQQYLQLQHNLEITPPTFIMLSLLGVKDYIMATNNFFYQAYPIDRDILLVPEVIVEDYTAEASDILRPAFDAIWQACGWERSQYYDDNGNWVRNTR